MKKIILINGLIVGIVIIGTYFLSTASDSDTGHLAGQVWLGYLVMIVAFSLIFFGIKQYRDRELGGVIRYRTGVTVGLGITLVSVAFSAQATTLTVDSLSDLALDDGICTLREAITAANDDAASGVMKGECPAGDGSDTIEFSIAGTIQPVSGLPPITTVIHIDGYSAPGASKNTLPLAQGTNAILPIEIDGVNAGNIPGIHLSGAGASGSIIEGLVINNSAAPVCCNHSAIMVDSVNGAATTTIRGNFLSTNPAGTERRPRGSRSIFIRDSTDIVVGSDTGDELDPADRNLISGSNSNGITAAGATNIRIRGNLVGTNASGTAALYNSSTGIITDSLFSSWISDNVISGNRGAGISLRAVSSDNRFERNFIGSNAAGTGPIPNTFGGIRISENFFTMPVSITNVDVVENLVAYNTCAASCGGITIGPSNAANTVEGIRLSANLVFSNQGLEIELGLTNKTNNGLIYGVTDNDKDDPDIGANTLQNFPVLTSATAAGLSALVGYTFNSEASKVFSLEFFYTSFCDESGYGGAESFLGTVVENTDGQGDASGQTPFTLPAEVGFITATATNSDNGTSEFSACIAIDSGPLFEDGFESDVL